MMVQRTVPGTIIQTHRNHKNGTWTHNSVPGVFLLDNKDRVEMANIDKNIYLQENWCHHIII